MARCLAWVASSLLAHRVGGLHISANIHYPETNSAVEHCGFQFQVATSIGDPEKDAVEARHISKDLFRADLELDDSLLYTSVMIGLLASDTDINRPECQAICPRVGPQGNQLQTGPFLRIHELSPSNTIDVWPSFCSWNWTTVSSSFHSDAIGKEVNIIARVPAAFSENTLARPSAMMPPIIFRFNSEWYWWNPDKQYNTLHDLMLGGEMENFIVAEVYIEGNDFHAWATQPIYTTEPLIHPCTCEAETQFICDAWNAQSYKGYEGVNHSFGSAPLFFDELYDSSMPQLLAVLPTRNDAGTLRVGAWGYCIGGLAAWNAASTRPEKFNFAYIGSPALDWNCGHAFAAVPNVKSAVSPKYYIDSGAGEGVLMNRQSLLLFHRLEQQGLVPGKDLFYERAPFGTHQGRALLRRSLKGLLSLFGTDIQGAGSAALLSRSTPSSLANVGVLATSLLDLEPEAAGSLSLYVSVAVVASAVLCFSIGRWSAGAWPASSKISKLDQQLLA